MALRVESNCALRNIICPCCCRLSIMGSPHRHGAVFNRRRALPLSSATPVRSPCGDPSSEISPLPPSPTPTPPSLPCSLSSPSSGCPSSSVSLFLWARAFHRSVLIIIHPELLQPCCGVPRQDLLGSERELCRSHHPDSLFRHTSARCRNYVCAHFTKRR